MEKLKGKEHRGCDRTRQDKTRQDKTRQEKTGQDRTRQDTARTRCSRQEGFYTSLLGQNLFCNTKEGTNQEKKVARRIKITQH